MAEERGVTVDKSTICRWVQKFTPGLEKAVRSARKPCGSRWRIDETYTKVKGKGKYFYRAVDSQGATVDYLLTAKRDRKAALRFLNKATKSCGKPEIVTIDKSGANKSAIDIYNKDQKEDIVVRQNKYLNNLIEQDHRGIK